MIKLTDYIYFGDYNTKIEALAALSPEQWNFNGQTGNGILKNYLQFQSYFS